MLFSLNFILFDVASNYSELLHPKPQLSASAGELPYKKLGDIMKIDLLQDKSADEIKDIWVDYHKQKDVLVATIPKSVYETLEARASEHPIFIVPLPRSQGFEFFLLQFAGNTVHFTPLLCYQVSISWPFRQSILCKLSFPAFLEKISKIAIFANRF